ncbi:protein INAPERTURATE POLLEN1 [Sesamum alatum]|uniref:Protein INAPERTURATE POLLEN1 n=1 Tax=Sesamum alatum TaxID=300844 RepID=A0AAE1Y9I5_9LAMI|nr:protein INAPERTURATE POLLEN1 [Sesamum alatum]
MFKSALFGRKKTTTRPFADFYNDWFTTLATTLLPQLRRALSSFPVSPTVLSTEVDAVYNHFHAYYAALDQAAAADVAQCLYPEWRNSLEKPFLWLGDLHPYLFTNLLRSFLEDQESSQDDDEFEYDVTSTKESLDTSWHVAAAWRSPSKALTARVDQIECGLRLMVPALAARARYAQAKLVSNVGAEWGRKEGVVKAAVAEAMAAEMEELVGVVVDANRLRRSVLADVLSVTSVYQAALFLEALAQFLVGFRDEKLLREFGKCGKAIN